MYTVEFDFILKDGKKCLVCGRKSDTTYVRIAVETLGQLRERLNFYRDLPDDTELLEPKKFEVN